MSRKEFEKKYEEVIESIRLANVEESNNEFSDAANMFISSIRGHNGEKYDDGDEKGLTFDIYDGIPEDFDWEQATADYKQLIKVREE